MKIYLIGLPGVGKSYWGKKIAKSQNLKFIDLDNSIEDKEQRTINKIFESKGEDYFRRIEKDVLYLESITEEDVLISCGGGTPCFHNNIDFMKEKGTVIYLKSTPKNISSNLKIDQKELSNRPLFKNDPNSVQKRTEELLQKRRKYYEKADQIIDVDRPENLVLSDLINLFSSKS